MKLYFLIVSLCSLLSTAVAQIKVPAASPRVTVIQEIGLSKVELSYARPSAKERAIFGEEALVPFGHYWRTGANAVTTIEITEDFELEGHKLSKGKYALLTKPNRARWEVLLYPYVAQPWDRFIEDSAALAIDVRTLPRKDFRESLLIFLEDVRLDGASLIIEWANTAIEMSIKIPAHDKIMSGIDRVMDGPSSFDYFNAASYLYMSKTDMERALDYIMKATGGERPTFFFYRREATILAELGRYDKAIIAANKSIDLARQVGNRDAVKLNERSIKAWTRLVHD